MDLFEFFGLCAVYVTFTLVLWLALAKLHGDRHLEEGESMRGATDLYSLLNYVFEHEKDDFEYHLEVGDCACLCHVEYVGLDDTARMVYAAGCQCHIYPVACRIWLQLKEEEEDARAGECS